VRKEKEGRANQPHQLIKEKKSSQSRKRRGGKKRRRGGKEPAQKRGGRAGNQVEAKRLETPDEGERKKLCEKGGFKQLSVL